MDARHDVMLAEGACAGGYRFRCGLLASRSRQPRHSGLMRSGILRVGCVNSPRLTGLPSYMSKRCLRAGTLFENDGRVFFFTSPWKTGTVTTSR